MRASLISVVAFCAVASVRAVEPPAINILDLGPNGTAELPTGLVGFDVEVVVDANTPVGPAPTPGDSWLSGVIDGTIVDGGSVFVHGNGPFNTPTAVDEGLGGSGGDTTFVNLPSAQRDTVSFVNEPRVGLDKAANFALIVQQPQAVDLQYFDSPGAPSTSDLGGGWTARLVIDMSGSAISPSDVFVSLETPPAAPIPIASGTIAVGTENFLPSQTRADWFISAIPEPGTVWLILFVGLLASRTGRTP
jgi:hypothetical protein